MKLAGIPGRWSWPAIWFLEMAETRF